MLKSWSAPLLETLEIEGASLHCEQHTLSFHSLLRLVLHLDAPRLEQNLLNLLSGMPSLQNIIIQESSTSASALLSVLGSFVPLTHRSHCDFGHTDSTEANELLLCPQLLRISLGFLDITEGIFNMCMYNVKVFLGARSGVVILLSLGEEKTAGDEKLAQAMMEEYKGQVIFET